MKLRIVDYVGNLGGGVRYTVQIARCLADRPDAQIELVSHGEALRHYRDLLGSAVAAVDIPPSPPRPCGLRNNVIGQTLGLEPRWNFHVPPDALSEGDVIWLPWIHRHVIPDGYAGRVVGTLVDVIALRHELLRPRVAQQERFALARWVQSDARLIAISQATADDAAELFDVPPERFSIIHLCGQPATEPGVLRPEWTWADRPFLLYPANISVHKNHETLFEAFAAWGQKHPLVLTGAGTDKLGRSRLDFRGFSRRARSLQRAARRVGLTIGKTVLPLGYITDAEYYALLQRARAVVVATLAEGAGLGVVEAIHAGVPVICTDIPPHREYAAMLGAEAIWTDPGSSVSLAKALTDLQEGYNAHATGAKEQAPCLTQRGWADVTQEYEQILLMEGAGGVSRAAPAV